MRPCLERRQVLNLGVPSRESIVDPRRQIVPEVSSRREQRAGRPCNGPSGRGIRRDELIHRNMLWGVGEGYTKAVVDEVVSGV